MKPYKTYVEEGFEILLPPLEYFVETELAGRFGRDEWVYHVADDRNLWKECGGDVEKFRKSLDMSPCIKAIRNEWQGVFCNVMDHEQRTWTEELLEWRNKLAHAGQAPWEREDSYRALDTMLRFAKSMGNQACVNKIKALRDEVSGEAKNAVDQPTDLPGGRAIPMSAAWFISYMYYDKIDRRHVNWRKAPASDNWISIYKRSASAHMSYLEEILKMDDSRLWANTIGLSARDIKRMAGELLALENDGENPEEGMRGVFPADNGSDGDASRGNDGKGPKDGKARHTFTFPGGEYLTTMGAVWFVSYMYYDNIDRKHLNWERVPTYRNRKSVYKRTTDYHRSYLEEILKMDDGRLETNSIGLSAKDVKRMARELLNRDKK